MMYTVDGLEVNLTSLNDTIPGVSLPRHYHTKSFVQYAYWIVALLQVSVCLFCTSSCVNTVEPVLSGTVLSSHLLSYGNEPNDSFSDPKRFREFREKRA